MKIEQLTHQNPFGMKFEEGEVIYLDNFEIRGVREEIPNDPLTKVRISVPALEEKIGVEKNNLGFEAKEKYQKEGIEVFENLVVRDKKDFKLYYFKKNEGGLLSLEEMYKCEKEKLNNFLILVNQDNKVLVYSSNIINNGKIFPYEISENPDSFKNILLRFGEDDNFRKKYFNKNTLPDSLKQFVPENISGDEFVFYIKKINMPRSDGYLKLELPSYLKFEKIGSLDGILEKNILFKK